VDFDLTKAQRAFEATAREFMCLHQILECTNEVMRLIVSRDLLDN